MTRSIFRQTQPMVILALAATLTITGCANRQKVATADSSALPSAGQTSTEGQAGTESGATATGLGTEGGLDSSTLPGNGLSGANGQTGSGANGPMDAVKSALAQRLVHFDYDSSTVSSDDLTTLNAHAGYLASHRAARVTLNGHTDERGTREYNLGLGERRAQAVQAFLVTNGARNEQIDTVSFGKEKPLNEGHSEAAWAENRRVEIQYDADAP